MFLQTALNIQRCNHERDAFDALVSGARKQVALRAAFRVARSSTVIEAAWNLNSSLSTELLDTVQHVLRAEAFALGSAFPVDAVNYDGCELLTLPIRVDGDHIATIGFIAPEDSFDADLISWGALGDAVALCESRARSSKSLNEEMDEQRRRAEESEALHTLGLATNRTLALDEVLDLVARFTRSLLGAHYAVVHTREDDRVETVATVGLKGPPVSPDAFAAHVIEAKKPAVASLDGTLAGMMAGHSAEDAQVAVGIPLTLFGETFGALVVGYRRKYEPTPRDIRLAMSVAQHASVAIANARLHARVEERSEELADAYRQLEQLTHAKERFYNAISHDLRTPVGAIKGYSELLLEGLGGELPAEALNFVSRIQRAGEALLALVNDLLDFAKLQAGHMSVTRRKCSLQTVIDDAVNAVSPQAKDKKLPLVIENNASVDEINTDPERVRQIVVNLLSNAVKFTREGSITLRATSTGEWIDLSVQDTGAGIPPEYHDKIFVEFEQVPGSVGTGLGLPIARDLSQLLGGSLTLESEVGIGSTFTLQLPLVDRADPDEAGSPQTRTNP